MNWPGRDSWIWYLGVLAAVLTYLSASESPALWHYDDWLKAATFAVSTLMGKLSQSPLPKGGAS